MSVRRRWVALAGALCICAGAAQAGAFSRDSLVWKKCTECHEPRGGTIPRVEEIRTTPEEWAVIVDRMHRLHGMDLSAGEMDQLLKELCVTQILRPDEEQAVAYLRLFNNTQHQEAPNGKEEERLFATCVRCHSFGKIASYRMTKENWAKVRDFHLYMDPAIMFQMREMHWIQEADAVLAYLAKRFPYGEAWKAPRADLSGEWVVLGYEPGKGPYRGTARWESKGGGDAAVSGTLRYSDGTSEVFRGTGTLYGGYALRTQTRHNGFETRGAFTLTGDRIQGEHHHPAPDFRTSTSTWYRNDGKARVLRVTPGYLLPEEETRLVLEGMNLPEVAARDVTFGPDVEVLAARRLDPGAIEAVVVSHRTALGSAEVKVKGLDAGSVTLAPRVDYIAVTPAVGRARLDGGPYYPPEGVQFEAVAYSNGSDVWDASDDVVLGPVPARFHLEEEATRPGDDDLAWVGAIEPDGTYLPVGDYRPIPAREYSGEGSGWVKVVAEYARGGREYRAEARLAVTVPDFIRRIK
ncbi:MAG: quinohemoprotein amine dehydrogenase subunit alpha [Candidatus Dadabacteria bacterium]|nr:MAG: quinohemoprotein amine dehydrogenase subunit alpha [Candidatus Dadabacteria bacterium]